MLFLLTGASGSGKTACLAALAGRLAKLALHDFDEVGVPTAPTPEWRIGANEEWLRRALRCQAMGRDMLLVGQTPLGELLACPLAIELDGIAACLLDCDDLERRHRLSRRPEDFGPEHFSWAEWQRRHAADPRWEQHVIRDAAPQLAWSRWDRWRTGDPRWTVRRIHTTGLSIEQVTERVIAWIEEQRGLHADGVHPLDGNWWDA